MPKWANAALYACTWIPSIAHLGLMQLTLCGFQSLIGNAIGIFQPTHLFLLLWQLICYTCHPLLHLSTHHYSHAFSFPPAPSEHAPSPSQHSWLHPPLFHAFASSPPKSLDLDLEEGVAKSNALGAMAL